MRFQHLFLWVWIFIRRGRCDKQADHGCFYQKRLPELDTSLSQRVRRFLLHLEGQRSFRRRFLMARQNLDGVELEFANMLVEDTNNGGMSYVDCEWPG